MYSRTTSRFVIAVFDEWHALHAALEDLSLHGIAPRGAVLYAPEDSPEVPPLQAADLISFFLAETTELPFSSARQRVAAPRVRSLNSWRRDPSTERAGWRQRCGPG